MLRFASVQYVKVGIVGGSDERKICEQLGANGMLYSTLSLPLSLQCLLVVCQNTSDDHNPNAAKDQVDFLLLKTVSWPTKRERSLPLRA